MIMLWKKEKKKNNVKKFTKIIYYYQYFYILKYNYNLFFNKMSKLYSKYCNLKLDIFIYGKV